MGIDAIVSLLSLFGPKAMDMVKGWIHRKDSPEATLAVLAQTNPAGLAEYTKANAALIEARVKQFNQDLPTEPTQEGVWKWIASLRELLEVYRGAIRPMVITLAFVHVFYVTNKHGAQGLTLIPEWIRIQYEIAVNSWFGDRWK
jgi:hypothetical protein